MLFFIFSDAKHVAEIFNCKYIETSATLNHKVDELLIGILKQIKLQLNSEVERSVYKDSTRRGSTGLLSRLFHRKSKVKINNCDDV